MKCPLFTTGSIDKGGMIDYKRWECLKEECAWWDKINQACVALTIADNLGALRYFLKDIKDEMPRAEQFGE